MRFGDPVADAQQTFRVLLDALARPAVPRAVPFGPALCAAALTLLDRETPVWLDEACSVQLRTTVMEGARAPIVCDPGDAAFAFAEDAAAMRALDRFAAGTPADPEASTTLFIAVESFAGGIPVIARGPGIADVVAFEPLGPTNDFWTSWDENARAYPQGVDVYFTCDDLIAGFPRTVRVERTGARAA